MTLLCRSSQRETAHGNEDSERGQEGTTASLNSVEACAGQHPAHRGHSTMGVDGKLLLGREGWNLFFTEDIVCTLVVLSCSHVGKEVKRARCVITMAGAQGPLPSLTTVTLQGATRAELQKTNSEPQVSLLHKKFYTGRRRLLFRNSEELGMGVEQRGGENRRDYPPVILSTTSSGKRA